jgi:putative cell wall-binding protein
MKKYFSIVLIAMLSFLVFDISAQTQMNTTPTLAATTSYYKYVGNASDTIGSVADSVSLIILNQFDHEFKLATATQFDTVDGVDTSVVISIWGKNFAGESYTLLSQTTSADITAQVVTTANYTTAVRYRYIKLSYKLKSTAQSTAVEIKLWKP